MTKSRRPPRPPRNSPRPSVAENEGNKPTAIAAYQALIDNFPTAFEAGIAKNRIKLLKPAPSKSTLAPPKHGGTAPRG